MGQSCGPGKGQEVVLEEVNLTGYLLNVSDGIQVPPIYTFLCLVFIDIYFLIIV